LLLSLVSSFKKANVINNYKKEDNFAWLSHLMSECRKNAGECQSILRISWTLRDPHPAPTTRDSFSYCTVPDVLKKFEGR
jgi:hypothetical protein